MILDPRQFEKKIVLHRALNADIHGSKLEYEGNAVLLRLMDCRTYGGVVRFFLDADGEPTQTGSTTVPIRIHDPFRLAEMSSYHLYFHLELNGLKDVMPQIVPAPELANAGLQFVTSFQRVGPLEVSAFTYRRMEITPMYPVGWLIFHGLKNGKKDGQGSEE